MADDGEEQDITRQAALNHAARTIASAENIAAPSATNLLRCAEMWLMLAEEIRSGISARMPAYDREPH